MTGAMHGLADSLDPDSAYLTADLVKQIEANAPLPAGDLGIDLTRQYWLRIIATRDGSPAAKAGLRTGDYVRLIGETPTREMSVFEGMRRLRGAPGTKISLTIIRGNANDPARRRTHARGDAHDGRHRDGSPRPGVGYLRIAAFGARTADAGEDAGGRSHEGRRGETDRRRAPHVGRFARRRHRAGAAVRRKRHAGEARNARAPTKETIAASGRRRHHHAADDPARRHRHVGRGRALRVGARRQQARRPRSASTPLAARRCRNWSSCPDGSGLWLTTTRYLTPAGTPLHEKGLEPTVAVDDAGRGVRPAARRPPTRSSKRRSNGSPRRRPRNVLDVGPRTPTPRSGIGVYWAFV